MNINNVCFSNDKKHELKMFILNMYTLRCLALPWLIFSMLEILILGCPAVIFFSLLGIYLYIQVNFYAQHLPVYPGTLIIYTWHLPVYSGTPLCSASTCIFRYTFMLSIYLYIQVHLLSILGIYLYIQVHLYAQHLPVYPGTLLIYTWHLPVYSGTPL